MTKAGLAAATGFGCSVLGTGASKVFTKNLEETGKILQVKGKNIANSYTRAQAKELTKQGSKLINTA